MSRNSQPKNKEVNKTSRTNRGKVKKLNGKEKIRKHIADINDVITDEDILNVKVEHYIERPTSDEALPGPGESKGGREEGTNEEKTSWDVID